MFPSLFQLSFENLTGKQKTVICDKFEFSMPHIYQMIMTQEFEKKEIIHDSIDQLYYDQIQNRYPEYLGKYVSRINSVVKTPLLKCCLKNQSIIVRETLNPLVLDYFYL